MWHPKARVIGGRSGTVENLKNGGRVSDFGYTYV